MKTTRVLDCLARFHRGGCASLLSLAAGVAMGCTERGVVPPVISRDSAGVAIVHSYRPQWSDETAWRVASEPIMAFGHGESLYQVRGAHRLDDGRIILGHASVPEVLVYASTGVLLERIGGRGSGPGEFIEFSRYRSGVGDSVMVYDYANQRLSILDREGRYQRAISTPMLPTRVLGLPMDIFADGSFVVTPFGGPPVGSGLVRRERELWRVSPDGTSAAPLVAFPELEQFFFQQGSGLPLRQPFFGKNAYYVSGGDRLIWAMNDAYEVRVHGLDGVLRSIYRKAHAEQTYSRPDVERLINEAVGEIADPNVQRARRLALQELPASGEVPALGWPDYGPSFGAELQLDGLGNLWVAEYYLPGAVRNARTVLDASGAWLGTVELPANFVPHQIGADFLLGVWRDELGVEEVRMYRLEKPQG